MHELFRNYTVPSEKARTEEELQQLQERIAKVTTISADTRDHFVYMYKQGVVADLCNGVATRVILRPFKYLSQLKDLVSRTPMYSDGESGTIYHFPYVIHTLTSEGISSEDISSYTFEELVKNILMVAAKEVPWCIVW